MCGNDIPDSVPHAAKTGMDNGSGPVLSLEGVTDVNMVHLLAFYWAPKSPEMVTADTELKDSCSLEEKLCQT